MPTETTKETKAPTPKLTCIITGRTRLTNEDYLNNKASGPAGTVKAFMNNYVCKDAMKLLRAGKTVDEVRTELGTDTNLPSEGWTPPEISKNALARIMSYNGKQKSVVIAPDVTKEVKTEAKPKARSRKKAAPKVEAEESSESQPEDQESAEVPANAEHAEA